MDIRVGLTMNAQGVTIMDLRYSQSLCKGLCILYVPKIFYSFISFGFYSVICCLYTHLSLSAKD